MTCTLLCKCTIFLSLLITDNPVVDISAVGSNIAGSEYSLTCTVTVVTGTPNITWIAPNGDEVDDSVLVLTNEGGGLVTTLDLVFKSLNYTDVGEYTCLANLSIPDANFLGMGSDFSTTVDIQSMLF